MVFVLRENKPAHQSYKPRIQISTWPKILLAVPVSQEQKAAEHLFIKNIMSRTTGSVSFHYIALQDMHWDHCSCSSQVKTKSVSPCRSIYPKLNRQGRRERKDLVVSADEKRRWSEIPELRQETCGRTTNWTTFRIAEDADWGELTARRFFWLTRSVKKKNQTNQQNCCKIIAIPELHQGGFSWCVFTPSTGTVCDTQWLMLGKTNSDGNRCSSGITGRGGIWKRWENLCLTWQNKYIERYGMGYGMGYGMAVVCKHTGA